MNGVDVLIHGSGVVFGLIALYFSSKVYKILGPNTRSWFVFSIIGVILLSIIHVADFFQPFMPDEETAETVELLFEHFAYIAGMAFIAFSYWAFLKKFEKAAAGK